MDTRDLKTNAVKANDDLGRHQRVLDAYLAHAGSDALPPPSLDAKLMALAASSVKITTKAQPLENHLLASDSGAISTINATARSRRRRWPFALAASVATIGFAAILARHGLLETPGYSEPTFPTASYPTASDPAASHQTGSYEAKSAAEQAQVDATAAVAAEVAGDAAAAASAPSAMEKPNAVLQEEMAASRDQNAAVPLATHGEDKAKLSAPNAELERTAEQAFGRVPTAPHRAAPADAVARVAAAAPAPVYEPALGDSEADRAEIALAAPVVKSESTATPEPIYAASPAPAMAPPPEVLLPDVPAAGVRSRRDSSPAMVPRAPTETPAAKAATALESAKEADSGGALPAIPEQREQSAPMPPLEIIQAGASVADDAPLDLKKDEFAPAGNAQNPHEKTYAAIRALRESGELQQAKAMLARFKKAYPMVVLPNDLKALAKEI